MEFFMAMQPPTVTAQEKKVARCGNKICFYEDSTLKGARSKLLAYLAKHRPTEPMDGALRLLCVWQWQTSIQHRQGAYRVQKPDTDNLQKMLKDCMTYVGYWHDDAQVVDERCVKKWAKAEDPPGIYIRIEGVKNGEG